MDTRAAAAQVMLIDDHEDSREMAAAFLKLAGFQVTDFPTADVALDAIKQSLPDVVVTDLTLPGMDGAEFARALRNGAKTSELPIIALTGHSDVTDDEGLFDAVVVKPFDPDRLIVIVQKALATRRNAAAR